MDTKYQFSQHESRLYTFWEKKGVFRATLSGKEPFCIVFPPPNANADLHLGHAMYVFEDIMIRYKKLAGKEAFWVAGADHAGIETQYVFEKHLKKQGKSRYDYPREELFTMIWDFVMQNRETMENQLRKLGFALDWEKKKFTMDPDIVTIVYKTFKHMFDKGLVYRANRLVNYCTSCGTSFSDLEVVAKDIQGKLYHIAFPLVDGGTITVATTRPETFFGDVAIMVHPKDKRYTQYVGKKAHIPLTDREIPIIADAYVDMKFGTGAVKVTPNHDFNDFEIAKKHKLQYNSIIGFDGKMQNTHVVDGLRVKKAREVVLQKLEEKGLLVKVEDHDMTVRTCYRCGTVLEPLPKKQWFVSIKPLASKAIALVETGKIKIHPSRFKKQLISILDNFIDWNISRQIVWGIRIPAYRCVNKSHKGNENWFASVEKPNKCAICGTCAFEQDEDTFDTCFSSSQWPFATLQTISDTENDYFSAFYPTTVMETGYDILRAWVARMIMVGYFETETIPFQHVYLHGMVRDAKGQKMSKSKGNVINPLDIIEQFGADALRGALVFGTKEGGDVVLSQDKIRAMRNFANKIWNIGRFIQMNDDKRAPMQHPKQTQDILADLQDEFTALEKQYHRDHKAYRVGKPFDMLYEFIWHRFADYYIETLKEEMRVGNAETCSAMRRVYLGCLKMLHPYLPFVTEAVWQEYHGKETSILQERFMC